jgi:hypothetical protein
MAGLELEEIVDGLAALEKVDEALNWHTGLSKTGSTAHAQGADPDCFIKPIRLLNGHTFTIGRIRQATQVAMCKIPVAVLGRLHSSLSRISGRGIRLAARKHVNADRYLKIPFSRSKNPFFFGSTGCAGCGFGVTGIDRTTRDPSV